MDGEDQSLLEKLDSLAPESMKSFDAFPKLPATYKSRSESRGFLTVFVAFLAFLLVLNDIGDFIWGWPDHEFQVDKDDSSFMNVNVDVVVNMPCRWVSVDLRDVVGDRLFLSKGFRRDGTLFDIGQATSLREHAKALSTRQALRGSRKSRGFFDIFKRKTDDYKPTYNYQPDGSACRIFGSLEVKKVTANLHITSLGHGYASKVHVDHTKINMSHVITEFSFGPHFPGIVQPLDNSFEITHDHFTAYQYFMRVVPTTYVAPRSAPLNTNQYSVTHYTHKFEQHSGLAPGIFFKFEIEPIRLIQYQRTTTFAQFFVRWAGVVGGVFVCTSWALRITNKAVTMVAGSSEDETITPQETARSTGLRSKWVGGQLRARPGSIGRVVRQGNSWVVEGTGSPYTGSFAGTPTSHVGTPFSPYSPAPYSPAPPSQPAPPPPMSARSPSNGSHKSGTDVGLGISGGSFGPVRSPLPTPGTPGSASLGVGTPNYQHFPPTPGAANSSFPRSPLPGSRTPSMNGGKKDD